MTFGKPCGMCSEKSIDSTKSLDTPKPRDGWFLAGYVLGALGIAIAVTLVFSAIATACWNSLASPLLGLPRASLSQGFAMIIASWLLASPFRAGGQRNASTGLRV
jgi:hypothetical protein